MRFIRKGREPAELRRWKQLNAGLPNGAAFENLERPVKEQLREQMMREQGHLCAYTMTPIAGQENCHIEHIHPRWRYPEREIDYENMLLCVPGNMDGNCEFGALKKGGVDVSEATFVSPLQPACETRLRFTFGGLVAAAIVEDAAAKRTIDILALNNASLVRERQDAIRLQGIGPSAIKPISAAKARRLADAIMQADASGRIPAYCVAVKQAAEIFAKQSEERAARVARKPAP